MSDKNPGGRPPFQPTQEHRRQTGRGAGRARQRRMAHREGRRLRSLAPAPTRGDAADALWREL